MSHNNQLAETLSQPQPTLAVPLTEELPMTILNSISQNADVAEFRADMFDTTDPDYFKRQFKRLAQLPLLLTIRMQTEGGQWTKPEAAREALFAELMPFVDGIDIELASNLAPALIDKAHHQGKITVASAP